MLSVKMERHRELLVYLKKDERLAEYVKVKDKYFQQEKELGLSKEEKKTIKNL